MWWGQVFKIRILGGGTVLFVATGIEQCELGYLEFFGQLVFYVLQICLDDCLKLVVLVV